MSSSGKTDILLIGATGFTGKLVVEYLLRHPQRHLFSLAIGARSKSRLDALCEELNIPSQVKPVVVDVTDADGVERVVKTTRVVINTVGPFYKWGTNVVAACARNGVHYVDITGENVWVRNMILRYHYAATKTKAIIVPSCGYDSIPSDMSAFVANNTLKSYLTTSPPSFQVVGLGSSTTAHRIRTGISGGTIASAITALEDVEPDEDRETKVSYSLSPAIGKPSPSLKLLYSLPIPNAATLVGGFFIMKPSNTAVVERTFGLLEQQAQSAEVSTNAPAEVKIKKRRATYGPEFVYDEFLVTPSSLSAVVTSFVLILGLGLLLVKPIRTIIKRYLPQSGSGPSKEEREQGFLECTNISTSAPSPGVPPITVQTVIKGKGDPGYGLTSVMLTESALCLILPPIGSTNQKYDPIAALPSTAHDGGILTPMTAFGNVLVDRLCATGLFTIDSWVVDKDKKNN